VDGAGGGTQYQRRDRPQSRESTRPFLQSSELGPPHPHASVPPNFGSVGGYTLAFGRGGGGPNSDEGKDTVVL
jgi:hypothetical protein